VSATVVLWGSPTWRLSTFIVESTSLGQTYWCDRPPAIDLAVQSVNVRQALAVDELRKPVVPNDTIDFILCLALSVWEERHSEIERIYC
jgi:hypothetical protein